MTLKASEVLTHARDEHPALTPMNAPDQILFRELSRGIRDLYGAIYVRVPGFLALTVDVNLPLADFAAGIDLETLIPGDWLDALEGDFILSSVSPPRGTCKGRFVPYEQRLRSCSLPAFTLRNNVIYFLGNEQDYSRFGIFRLSYTPNPADITKGTDVVPLSHDAREPLATRLAAFALGRLVSDPSYKVTDSAVAAAQSKWGVTRREYLTGVFRITQRQHYEMSRVDVD